MKKYIKFKIWKFSLMQALVPPVFFLGFNALTGFQLPSIFMFGFSLVGSIGFAIAGAALAAMVLESVMENGHLKNTFGALGRGSVNISRAKQCFSPDFIFILLKDKENKAFVRIPKPFWADDPKLIKCILDEVRN